MPLQTRFWFLAQDNGVGRPTVHGTVLARIQGMYGEVYEGRQYINRPSTKNNHNFTSITLSHTTSQLRTTKVGS